MSQIRRRQLLIAAAAILALLRKGHAQQPDKVWRIGFLVPSLLDPVPGGSDPYAVAFMCAVPRADAARAVYG